MSNNKDSLEESMLIKQARRRLLGAVTILIFLLILSYFFLEERNEVKKINLEGIFVQIGLIPNSDFLKGTIELNNYGEIIVSEKGETSSPGIFACGDVTTVPHKQIIISMGEGAKASITAADYLQKNKIDETIQESA